MTCSHAPSTARLLLLVLIIVTSQPAGAAPARAEGGRGRALGKEDHLGPFLSLPGRGGWEAGPADSAQILAILLKALDRPGGGAEVAGGRGEGPGEEDPATAEENSEGGAMRTEEAAEEGERGGGAGEKGVRLPGGLVADDLEVPEEKDVRRSEEEPGLSAAEEEEEKEAPAGGGEPREKDQAGEEEEDRKEEKPAEEEEEQAGSVSQEAQLSLQRKIRGYFKNIDLGLQDNEILPPLKGYKAYNTQLARAGKKLHWQAEPTRQEPTPSQAAQGGNFMDDFEGAEELEEELEEEEEEEESLTRLDEEARARAEKQEVLRQQEEAELAREEEQRLADVASDMLLQYMGRKQRQQRPSYAAPRRKSGGGGGADGNTAEDKRSEEELLLEDDGDQEQQMIDRLIEISSRLHLPADDVVEIISDVEEKKKKRKELQQKPSLGGGGGGGGNGPVVPRFRPLVPPPLVAPPMMYQYTAANEPMYHYTASKNPKKAFYVYKSNKKWQKDKAKSYKQDYWYKPQKKMDYWYKPQKQFLAFPSYPYYQKPYRAYYPVYFPYPKNQFYGKPAMPRDQPFGPPQELDFQPPRRRQRVGGKGRGQGQGWRRQPPPQLPVTPYISNYILPHPRTYQPLPPAPKPIPPARRGRQPPYFYAPVNTPSDYEEDGLVPQLDSEEELENFIERIYMKRRMY